MISVHAEALEAFRAFFSYLSDCRRDLRSGYQIFAPTFEIGILIVDHYAIALAPGIKRNKRDVRQRVIADDVFPAGHFFVQSLEMLFHPFIGLVRFSVMRKIGSSWMDPAIHEVDPDARFRPKQGVAGHQANLWKSFLEVFVDDRRLINYSAVVHQHRHFAIRISRQQILGFVLEINLDQLVGKFLLR